MVDLDALGESRPCEDAADGLPKAMGIARGPDADGSVDELEISTEECREECEVMVVHPGCETE